MEAAEANLADPAACTTDEPRPTGPATSEEPGPSVPEDAHSRLERWKQKLLDLTLRNKLLNFRETKKTIPLLCPDLPAFEDALADGKEFVVLPNPEVMEGDDPRDPELHLRRTGEDRREEFLRAHLQQRLIHSRLTDKELRGRLLQLFRGSRLSLEEGGVNTLYLVLGFLSWYESEDSDRERLAPLLLLPLELKRKSVHEGFRLQLTDEEPRLNTTLLNKLSTDHGLAVAGLEELPEDESGLDVPLIMRRIREAIRDVPRWDLKEQAWIGLFSFTKELMWRDLEQRAESLMQSEVVRLIVTREPNSLEPGGEVPDPDSLDQQRSPLQTFCPMDADSSQLAAVFAADDGTSLVLQGPPGTGKSQTITNLISQCIAQGKTVLFVAEKMAALEVVHRRLCTVGLEPFCLELHSNKARKKQVIEQLGKALNAAASRSQDDWQREAGRLQGLRQELNRYVGALHRPRSFGRSVFQATSRLIGLHKVSQVPVDFGHPESVDRERLEELREAVAGLQASLEEVPVPTEHRWRAVSEEDPSPIVLSKLPMQVDQLGQLARRVEAAANGLSAQLGLPPGGWSWERLEALEQMGALLAASPHPPEPLLLEEDWYSIRTMALRLVELGRRRDDLWNRLAGRYGVGLLHLDLLDLWLKYNRWSVASPPVAWLMTRSVRKALGQVAVAGLPPFREIGENLRLALAVREDGLDIGEACEEADSVALFWHGGRADWDRQELVVQWIDRLRAAAWTLCSQNNETWFLAWTKIAMRAGVGVEAAEPERNLSLRFDEYRALLAELRGARESLVAELKLDESVAWGDQSDQGLLRRIEELVSAWRDDLRGLNAWCAFLRARQRAETVGLTPLVAAVEDGTVHPGRVGQAFERSFYEWWLHATVGGDEELRGFHSAEHNRKITRFRKLDKQVIKLTSDLIRARAASRVPTLQGRTVASSEMGILRRELKKKRRHLPPRKLFGKIPNLLPRLKPCFLMSPLSVSQFLDVSMPRFDLVVFDEASQVPVWDAIGALARGKKAVVVGDSKQLPPTSFFQKVDDEDAPTEDDLVDLESILDECAATQMPTLSLRWHYRSRHEGLIAFSNQNYYENRLNTFPCAAHEVEGLGVSWRHVPDGVYDRAGKRSNAAEARAVVAEIVKRLKDPKQRHRSIGVVTFSMAQQNLIDDLLEEERNKDQEVDRWLNEGDEPVFVKNLENVQGDERAVMLFSICYGPDQNGRVYMNFGPLNKDGGQRRLNVAITRAREEVIVFSTLQPDQMNIKHSSPPGVKDLKLFLEYADKGPPALEREALPGQPGGFDSPFEEAVHEALEKRGWQVDSQVGCSGYRIDLGVHDPDRQGSYLLGVECDGATYHSAATARDRDRLREQVLRGLGWEIHRIWSTDWWIDPHGQVDKVIAALEKVREEKDREPEALAEAEPSPDAPEEATADPAEEASAEWSDERSSPVALAPPPEGLEPTGPVREPPGLVGHHAQRASVAANSDGAREPVGGSDRETYKLTPDVVLGEAESFHDRREAPRVRQRLIEVVETEAPIVLDLATRRVASSWGLSRLTKKVRRRIEAPLQAAVRGGQLQLVDEVLWSSAQDPNAYRTFRAQGGGEAPLRKAQEIPLVEVSNAAEAVLKVQIALPLEDLARETARQFGIQRLGKAVREHMVKAIEMLAERGGCVVGEDGDVRVVD